MSDSVLDQETTASNNPGAIVPPEKTEEESGAAFKRIMTNWQEYYSGLKDAERKKMIKHSLEKEFDIEFLPIYNMQDGNLIEDGFRKKYSRRKIPTKLANAIEIKRGEFRKEPDPAKAAKLIVELYGMMAAYYLVDEDKKPMKKEDFDRTDWEQVKPILDGCNHGTVYGRHPLEVKT